MNTRMTEEVSRTVDNPARLSKRDQVLVRIPQLLVTASVAGLVLIGGLETVVALSNPDAWSSGAIAADAASGVVGAPQPGAEIVATVHRLVSSNLPPEESVVVFFPAGSSEFTLIYARYQLLHLMYPRRVEVVDVRMAGSLSRADVFVTLPGVRVSDAKPILTDGDFAIFRRGAK
jgi:hypothetical protein